MKKRIMLILITLSTALAFTGSAYSLTFTLEDWGFNPSGALPGTPGKIQPIDEITFLGTAYVDQEGAGGPGTSFTDQGAFQATALQNDGAVIRPAFLNSPSSNGFEITGVLSASGQNTTLTTGATGNLTDQNFIFNQGTLDIYIDATLNYGDNTDPGFFGANDGERIASFQLIPDAATGDFDFAPEAVNGQIDIAWNATFLAEDVWFSSDGSTDLADLLAQGLDLGAQTNSDNNLFFASDTTLDEWNEFFGPGITNTMIDPDTGAPSPDFFTRSDGSYAPTAEQPPVTVIPEPGTVFLLGLGLIGLAGIGRKKITGEI